MCQRFYIPRVLPQSILWWIMLMTIYYQFPGTSASDSTFQAYLLEGVARWNQDREAAALQTGEIGPHCYNARLRHAVNRLGDKVLGKQFNPTFRAPRKFTGN
jgi:hypothetical protein